MVYYPKMHKTTLKIGQVSNLTGLSLDAIRFYEREKLIPPPTRGFSGYRQYHEDVLERIFFILQAKQLGFTLSEISALLSLRFDPIGQAIEVKEKALTKITQIDEKIKKLQKIKKELTRLATACNGQGSSKDCAIINGLINKAQKNQKTLAEA